MTSTANIIAQRIGKVEKLAYERIFSPKIVAIPPEDSRRAICVLADGEIRVYGATDKTVLHGTLDTYRPVYISSKDGGLSWKEYDAQPNDIGACVYVPWTKKYVTIHECYHPTLKKTVVCCFRSDIGPGDVNPEIQVVTDSGYHDFFQPLILEKRKRIIATAHTAVGDEKGYRHYKPVLFISDDGGSSWSIKQLPTCPRFVQAPPHKGMRWENDGAEPTVTRLKNGVLWALLRTSQDYMYECFSYDDGDTWTDAKQSRFHMTLTTPFPLTLQDGRTLIFWNNANPLPEQDKSTCQPPLPDAMATGVWEDVFTNRDASHVAVTDDDGETFIGFRELLLSVLRNNVDFRTHGSMYDGNDRSVQQFQAIELPMGKILVSVGQHEESRKLIIFDVNWLYETARTEDFSLGLKNVSVQGFLKSISGTYTYQGIPGHCQWNRLPTVFPAPNPDGTPTEAQQFVYNDDPRLLNGLSGMAWNFPSSQKGRIKIEFYRKTSGLQLCLADEWIHPTDEYASHTAEFCLSAEKSLPTNQWLTLTIEWDCAQRQAKLLYNENCLSVAKMQGFAPFGISYLHLQTLSRSRDFNGSYIRKLEKVEL